MTESNFKMVDDRVAVKRKNTSEKTEGGILIAGAIKSKTNEGTIVAVGPGKKYNDIVRPLDVSVGDQIMFEKTAGIEVTIDGDNYTILKEAEILLIIE